MELTHQMNCFHSRKNLFESKCLIISHNLVLYEIDTSSSTSQFEDPFLSFLVSSFTSNLVHTLLHFKFEYDESYEYFLCARINNKKINYILARAGFPRCRELEVIIIV